MLIYLLNPIGTARQKIVAIWKSQALKCPWFILDYMAIEKGTWETIRYMLFVVRMENLRIFFAEAIIQEMFLWVSSNHDIANSFV